MRRPFDPESVDAGEVDRAHGRIGAQCLLEEARFDVRRHHRHERADARDGRLRKQGGRWIDGKDLAAAWRLDDVNGCRCAKHRGCRIRQARRCPGFAHRHRRPELQAGVERRNGGGGRRRNGDAGFDAHAVEAQPPGNRTARSGNDEEHENDGCHQQRGQLRQSAAAHLSVRRFARCAEGHRRPAIGHQECRLAGRAPRATVRDRS